MEHSPFPLPLVGYQEHIKSHTPTHTHIYPHIPTHYNISPHLQTAKASGLYHEDRYHNRCGHAVHLLQLR